MIRVPEDVITPSWSRSTSMQRSAVHTSRPNGRKFVNITISCIRSSSPSFPFGANNTCRTVRQATVTTFKSPYCPASLLSPFSLFSFFALFYLFSLLCLFLLFSMSLSLYLSLSFSRSFTLFPIFSLSPSRLFWSSRYSPA